MAASLVLFSSFFGLLLIGAPIVIALGALPCWCICYQAMIMSRWCRQLGTPWIRSLSWRCPRLFFPAR